MVTDSSSCNALPLLSRTRMMAHVYLKEWRLPSESRMTIFVVDAAARKVAVASRPHNYAMAYEANKLQRSIFPPGDNRPNFVAIAAYLPPSEDTLNNNRFDSSLLFCALVVAAAMGWKHLVFVACAAYASETALVHLDQSCTFHTVTLLWDLPTEAWIAAAAVAGAVYRAVSKMPKK